MILFGDILDGMLCFYDFASRVLIVLKEDLV
jgi:hypothetical protein